MSLRPLMARIEPSEPASPAQVETLLRALAARLIWWQSPEDSLRHPDRVVAQVMDLGDFESVSQLRRVLGDQRLSEVLKRAEAGWFSPRSWTYWHRKLNEIGRAHV